MQTKDKDCAVLGALRVVVFGSWTLIAATDSIQDLATLPSDTFLMPTPLGKLVHDFGFIESEWPWWLLRVTVVGLCALATLGVARSRVIVPLAVLFLTIYQAAVRGYSAHVNHAEMASLYVAFVLAVYPSCNGLELASSPRPTPSPLCRDALRLARVVFLSTYALVGIARLVSWDSVLKSPTLRLVVAENAMRLGSVTDSKLLADPDLREVIATVPAGVFVALFWLATLFELVAPIALIGGWVQRIVLLAIVSFHLLNEVLVGPVFRQNVILAMFLLGGPLVTELSVRADRAVSRAQSKRSDPRSAYSRS